MKTLFLLAAIAIGTYVVTTAASSPVYACGGVGSPQCPTVTQPDTNAPTAGTSVFYFNYLKLLARVTNGVAEGDIGTPDENPTVNNRSLLAGLPQLPAVIMGDCGLSATMCLLISPAYGLVKHWQNQSPADRVVAEMKAILPVQLGSPMQSTEDAWEAWEADVRTTICEEMNLC
jgi:hypothetical protein